MATQAGALMPEWADLVKIVAALASGGLLAAILARRTGRDTVAMSLETVQLQEMTKQLVGRLNTYEAELALYKAIGDERAKLVDAVRLDLTAAQAREAAAGLRETAAQLREADCQQRLTRTEARLNALFGPRADSYD